MNRRLLHHVLDSYGTDPASRTWSTRTELWFVPVANPDGYDYTFTEGNRLWRKNLRDNDGDGQITGVDGVDLNRNFAYKWGYDNEGSSPDPSSDTYRGPAPNSEPETQALDRLFSRVRLRVLHQLPLRRRAAALRRRLAGQHAVAGRRDLQGDGRRRRRTRRCPATTRTSRPSSTPPTATPTRTSTVKVRHARLHAGDVHLRDGVRARTPTTNGWPEDCVSDFIFPDDEDLIQAEFAKNIPFALAIGPVGARPGRPGVRRRPQHPRLRRRRVRRVVRPQAAGRGRSPAGRCTDVRMHYSVNGGRPSARSASREWRGGERYGDVQRRLLRRAARQGRPGPSRVTRSRSGSPAASVGGDGGERARSPTRCTPTSAATCWSSPPRT